MSAPTEHTGRALAVLGAALAFGLGADILARTVPARLDLVLMLGALATAGGSLVYRGLVPAPIGLARLGVPFAFLVVALIWRDSTTLFLLNLLGLGLLLTLASPRLRSVGCRGAGLGSYVLGGLQVATGTAGGAAALLTEIDWRSVPEGGPARRLRGTLVGLGLATPVAAVFGGLLMDADPIFHGLMTAALGRRLDQLIGHGIGTLWWAWLGAGLLRLLLLRRPDTVGAPSPRPGKLGLTEVGPVLLVVDLLFAAFVLVQFRYLFGGAAVVQQLTGLSYAEYARQGFFQLVAVAALSLPLLLVADAMLGRRDPTSVRRFRLLAAAMLLLLNVMLASALWRMRLYTAEYGLTELRLYTTAFMGWLVIVFGWFAATVMRGRPARFGFGAVVAALFVLATLNLVNPDALIASSNLARASRGRPVDGAYLARLSADAFPTIHGGLGTLSPAERCSVAFAMQAAESGLDGRWNIAIVRASEFPSFTSRTCLARTTSIGTP